MNPARIDFVALVLGSKCYEGAKQSGFKLFALTQISKAYAEYMNFGIGDNGYKNPVRFFEASEFFFRTRSYEPDTWKDSPPITEVFTDPETGKRVKRTIVPPEETLRLQCFDKYYEFSGLNLYMPIDEFLWKLQAARRTWVIDNREQISTYLDFCRRYKYKRSSSQLEFMMESPDFIEIMVCPDTPEQLDSIIRPYVPLPSRAYHHHRLSGRRLKRKSSFSRPVTIAYGQQEFVLAA